MNRPSAARSHLAKQRRTERFKNELDALETEEQALPEHGRVWDNLEHRKAAIVAQKNQAATKLHPISAERNRLIARIREFEKMAARDHGGLIETVKASCLRLEQAVRTRLLRSLAAATS